MLAPETAETTGFKQCRGCGVVQINSDKFCRRCGVSCSLGGVPHPTGMIGRGFIEKANLSGDATAPPSESEDLHRSYSGPLVGIVTRKLSAQTSPLRAHRWVMFLIGLTVAAPLWLMIVLLSPLDAYLAARDVAGQM